MDRPTNPMVVSGLVELERVLAVADACGVLRRLTAFRPFAARVVEPKRALGTPSFLPIDDLDVSEHVTHVQVADDAELRAYVGRMLGTGLDPGRPLWSVVLLDRPGRGTTLLFRAHHSLADGYALLRVLERLCDATEGMPTIRGQSPRATDRLLGAVRSLERIVTLPADPPTRLRAPLSGEKRIAWSEPLSLADVRRVARTMHATTNDVIVALVAGCLRRYLEVHGDPVVGLEVHALVPVDLRRHAPDDTLGNHFGLVFLGLPIGIADPLQRLLAVQQRMRLLKRAPEAAVTHGLLALMGHAPQSVEDAATRFFGRKASLVVTSVPGPRERVSISGIPVTRMTFWVPEAAQLGLGLSIFSYAGEITVGALADAAAVPDPDVLVAEIHAELAAMETRVRGFPRPPPLEELTP